MLITDKKLGKMYTSYSAFNRSSSFISATL